MPQQLSLPHLMACLAEKERYKGTQAYLSEVQRLNEQVYPLVNAALLETLLDLKTSPMSRLLSLRFFKEVLVTANFSLIDAIDEKIEEHVLSVAQYNKKSKEVNRGANFFSDVYNVKNDAEMQKISSSYVLLALEIVAAFGKWYQVDEDGEETRFVQYLLELTQAGVSFPTELNFFKKDEEEKFKKNYQKWAKGYKAIRQEQEKVAQPQAAVPKITASISTRQQAQILKEPLKPVQQKPTAINFNDIPQYLIVKQRLSDQEEMVNMLQSKLKEEQSKNILLQNSVKSQETVIAKLQEDLATVSLSKDKRPTLSIEQECYKIFISPPINTDDMIEQIDSLKEILQQTTRNYQQEKTKMENEIKQLISEKQYLKVALRQKEEAQARLKQQQQKKIIDSNVEASLLIIDEPRIGSRQREEQQVLAIKEKILATDRKEEVLKDYSNNSRILRDKLGEVTDNKVSSNVPSRQGSRSLKKTESNPRHKVSHTASTSNFMKLNNAESKLTKTAQNFRSKQDSGKLITIFPFLETYFPELPNECKNFKKHCLSLTQPSDAFFENEWIKAVLIKRKSERCCFLQVSNKTGCEQKIKVLPTHPCLTIEGDKIKKVPANTVAEFQMKMGAPDLNMRCPMVSIIIGNHGISLTTSTNEKIFHLPLPITLLDFFSFKKPVRKLSSPKTIKYGANRFLLASSIPNLQQCFPSLTTQFRQGESFKMTEIQWSDACFRLQFSEWSKQVSLAVEYGDDCPLGGSIGKVLLQILMYLLRE